MDTLTLALVLNYAKKQAEEAKKEGFKVQVEQDRSILDRAGEEKVFYFLPKSTVKSSDGYDEFIYTNNNWEQVGATDVDLSSYATKSEVGDLNNLPTTDKSSIVSAISETFTSVSNGKLLVASAITDKGVSTSSDATFEIMARNIEAIPSGAPVVSNPALVLWDWEGTKLAAYSREDALALTELPAPETLFPYAGADHELLVFQSWNWSLADIKAWIQNHEGETLDVGAIYTTTDGADHNYWGSPRLNGNQSLINMCKRGTIDDIGYKEFGNCNALEKISIPYGASSIGFLAFTQCVSLFIITIPNGITNIDNSAFSNCQSLRKAIIPPGLLNMGPSAFNNCLSLKKISIPDSVTSIGNNAFNNCQSLVDIKISNNITSFESTVFQGCLSLPKIHITGNVISIGNNAFNNCVCLCDIFNECKAALANINAFNGLPGNYRIYVPRANLSWFETATNWSTIYTQGHIVAIEDYIDYLESIGFNVDKYKEATA